MTFIEIGLGMILCRRSVTSPKYMVYVSAYSRLVTGEAVHTFRPVAEAKNDCWVRVFTFCFIYENLLIFLTLAGKIPEAITWVIRENHLSVIVGASIKANALNAVASVLLIHLMDNRWIVDVKFIRVISRLLP